MLKTSLKSFLSVARHGSIRAASNELSLAQSAISRQLQALEHEVGARLFERRPRGVVLTEAGELLNAYGRSAISSVDRLESEMDALRGLRRGRVRIAAIESLVPSLLPRAIDKFLLRHPAVTFAVDVLTTDQIVAAVRAGDVDIGVGFSPTISSDVAVYHRIEEPLLVVMLADHPLAALERWTIGEVAEYPISLPSPKSGARYVFDRACQATSIVVNPLLETNSIELLHQFALLGRGVTILLRHTIGVSLRSGLLKAAQLEADALGGTLDILVMQGRVLPLAAEAFLLVLRNTLDCDAEESTQAINDQPTRKEPL